MMILCVLASLARLTSLANLLRKQDRGPIRGSDDDDVLSGIHVMVPLLHITLSFFFFCGGRYGMLGRAGWIG